MNTTKNPQKRITKRSAVNGQQLSRESLMAKQLNQPFKLMAQDAWGNSYVVAYGDRVDMETILAITDPARNPVIVPNN